MADHPHLCEICGWWSHDTGPACILEQKTACPAHVLGEEGLCPQSNGTATWRNPHETDGFGPPTLIRGREIDGVEADDRPGPEQLLPLSVRETRCNVGRVTSMETWLKKKIDALIKENAELKGV